MRLLLVVAALSSWSGLALAQQTRGQEAAAYTRAVQRGHEGVRRSDWQAATDGYGEAAALRPRSGEPVLFQAMMLRARDDLAGALARFREAARIAQAADEDSTRAKAMMGVAMVLEQQRQFPAARTAYQEYVTFAEGHTSIPTFVAVGRARIQMIDRVDELDQAYREVRARIAERERENRRGGGDGAARGARGGGN